MTQRKILMKILGAIGSDFGLFSQLIISSEDESVLTSFVVVVQSLSHVWLFVTPTPHPPPWTAECKASLSFAISQSLLKLMSIEWGMPSNHLILLPPSPPAFNLSQHQSLFQWVSSSHQMAKILELQLQHQNWFPLGLTGLISLQCKGLSRDFSSTTVQQDQLFGAQPSL